MQRRKDRFKLFLVALWLACTVALASWWMVFGLHQVVQLQQVAGGPTAPFEAHYRMLLWEGGVLIALLVGGGAALLSYVWRERRRHRQIEEFFAAFTHDAKTSLASLRLQAESLAEDLAATPPNPLLERLLKDTVRLQLQLENSLFLANLRSGRLWPEALPVSRMVQSLRYHWPEIELSLEGDGLVRADTRALESVLANLMQNAVTHGQARAVKISVQSLGNGNGRVRVQVADDGQGFAGDFKRLGTLFVRHTRSSGTGVGLYISRQLVRRMGGSLTFAPGPNSVGFLAELTLPKAAQTDAAAQLKRVPA